MKIEWTSYKGKRILRVDYSGLNEQQMIAQLEQGTKVILNEKEKILYLGNFTETVVTSTFMDKANALAKQTDEKLIKGAIVGVTGMKSVLLNTYNMLTGSKMKSFKTEAEALEYLVKA